MSVFPQSSKAHALWCSLRASADGSIFPATPSGLLTKFKGPAKKQNRKPVTPVVGGWIRGQKRPPPPPPPDFFCRPLD
jgi:hypothetical protein